MIATTFWHIGGLSHLHSLLADLLIAENLVDMILYGTSMGALAIVH
jgi:hypothetical protein